MLLATACREAFTAFGSGARARAASDQLFGALADRHVDILRNAKYEYAREQLTRGALLPSKVFDDSAAWTGSSGSVRILETFGSYSDGRYLMNAHPRVTAPAKPGDGRHVSTLSKLSDNEYRWDTSVDFALGSVQPSDIALLVERLLSAAEGRDERAARTDLASAAPHASAAMGTLFTLDSLHPTPLVDGSTSVLLSASIHSDRLKARMPALADYVRRYVEPARYRVVLSDRAGLPYFEAEQHDRVVSVRARTMGGHLVALNGPARAMPDTLELHMDFTVKVKIFTVGFHDLDMEFVNASHGDAQRDWTMVARKEPHWNLPLITARLIRAPLRRPFAGEGALFRIGVRAGVNGAPTVLFRQSRLVVQESAILRFLNSLSSTAMDDFGARVEHEENLWLRELFLAAREDGRAVIGP